MAPSRRLVLSCLLLMLVSLAVAVFSLRSGAVTLDFTQVFNALTGSAPRNITMVVTEWRLPRVMMAEVSHDPLEFRYRVAGTGTFRVHGEELTGKPSTRREVLP